MKILIQLWFRLVGFGFRLLYNELAWTYDAVSWVVSWGQWRPWQQAAVPYLTGRRVLEIAHGPGHMLVELTQQGFDVTGCDLSPAMGQLARKNCRTAGVLVPLLRVEIPHLPFAPNSFDSVLSTFPTNFIAQPATIQAIHHVLRPGGRFVIVPEGQLTGSNWFFRFLDWLFVVTGQRTHNTQQVREMWQQFVVQMEAAGFTAEVKQIVLPKSVATVVVATKR